MLRALKNDMREWMSQNQKEDARLKKMVREVLIELLPSLERHMPKPARPKLTLVKKPAAAAESLTPSDDSSTCVQQRTDGAPVDSPSPEDGNGDG